MTTRIAFLFPAIACAALLAFGYYLQYGQGLDPCPLCLVQRGFFYGVLGICLIAALHNPGRAGRVVYGALAALFALGGTATAGRQAWLQHLPPERQPQCGPDLYFMLDNFPLSRTLEKLITGTGECAAVDWTFLGLSIAEWSLGWFVVLFIYALWLALRTPRSAPEPVATFPEVDGRYR
jgi:disulfide bond formation protein DsbB